MPLLPDRPRTRLEEIVRARGLSQTELGLRAGWYSSTVNRLIVGRHQLTGHTRRVMARILEVRESAFHEPIGAPIPPPRSRRMRAATFAEADFSRRLSAVLALLGLADLDGLVRFLVAGDYGRLRWRSAYASGLARKTVGPSRARTKKSRLAPTRGGLVYPVR
jgi:hypothetical protein